MIVTPTKSEVKAKEVLRLNVDGAWTANAFAELMQALEQIYLFVSLPAWKDVPGDFPEPPSVQSMLRLADAANFDSIVARLQRVQGETQDFLESTDLSSLNELRLAAEALHTAKTISMYAKGSWKLTAAHMPPGQQLLRVTRISYSSPGFVDLAGLGQSIGHLKDFLLEVLRLARDRKAAKVDLERRQVELKLLKLDLELKSIVVAREKLAFLRDSGYPADVVSSLEQTLDRSSSAILNLASADLLKGVAGRNEA